MGKLFFLDIIATDHDLFLFLNKTIANGFFDFIMPPIRNKYIWIPFYVFTAGFSLLNLRENKWIFIGVLILTMTISDQTSSNLVKNYVKRVRPCNSELLQDKMILRIRCSRGYSFTSSHATNHFALATYLFFCLGRYLKLYRWPIFVWASVISFAQIYVGVHYPLDILFGTLLGIGIGRMCYKLQEWLQYRYAEHQV